ncbi:PREDICTED: cystatin-B [Dipodomys ordii]|uniref:Cystatin-B n=1 Tax=Dipodomys ordii TaxID=10020 RepID=A0A1S3G3E3_DIPOR|nr:PREDICTED: cystatin-B [Dipodomys ordii]
MSTEPVLGSRGAKLPTALEIPSKRKPVTPAPGNLTREIQKPRAAELLETPCLKMTKVEQELKRHSASLESKAQGRARGGGTGGGLFVPRRCGVTESQSLSFCAPQVKQELEEKENRKFSIFKALSFKSQVVSGTNYFIKVDVGGEEFVHLKVFQSLPHENKPPALSAYQSNKSQQDELAYF